MSDFRTVIETDSVALGWEDGQPALRRGAVVTPITELIAPDLVDLLDVPWGKAAVLEKEFDRYVFSLEKGERADSTEVLDAIIWAGLRSGEPLRNRQAVEWGKQKGYLTEKAALALRNFVEIPAEGKDPDVTASAKSLLKRWRKNMLMIPAYTPEKLKEFVLGVLDNRIFLSAYLDRPEDLTMVFMVLGLGALHIPDACLKWLPELPPTPSEPKDPEFPPCPENEQIDLPKEPVYTEPDPKHVAELDFRIRWNHEAENALADYLADIEKANAEVKAAWEAETLKVKDAHEARMETWKAECKGIRKDHRESLAAYQKALRDWKDTNKDLLVQHKKRDASHKRLFKRYTSQIGVFWEFYAQAMPRSINGYPMFASCRLMNLDDWKRCVVVINEERERREKLSV